MVFDKEVRTDLCRPIHFWIEVSVHTGHDTVTHEYLPCVSAYS